MQRITAPTLNIVGDGDIVTSEHAVEMFQSIPLPGSVWSRGAGHGVMPKETVLTFLEVARAVDQ